MKIIIEKPHSIIDLITNSSTELFITDDQRELETIREMIKSIETDHPNKYGHTLYVDYADDWRLGDIYGCYDAENVIKYLTTLGYEIIPPKPDHKKYIEITAERGGMSPIVEKFINDNFNIIYYSSEA